MCENCSPVSTYRRPGLKQRLVQEDKFLNKVYKLFVTSYIYVVSTYNRLETTKYNGRIGAQMN